MGSVIYMELPNNSHAAGIQLVTIIIIKETYDNARLLHGDEEWSMFVHSIL